MFGNPNVGVCRVGEASLKILNLTYTDMGVFGLKYRHIQSNDLETLVGIHRRPPFVRQVYKYRKGHLRKT